MAYIDDELAGDEVKAKGAPTHQPRLRQRMIGIGVALLAALALAVLVFFLYIKWRLYAVYGPGGELDQEYARARRVGRLSPADPADRPSEGRAGAGGR